MKHRIEDPKLAQHGVTLDGYDTVREGIADAMANGKIICMPRVSNLKGERPEHCTIVDCPMCGEKAFRDNRIPPEAKAACTNCAVTAALRSRG